MELYIGGRAQGKLAYVKEKREDVTLKFVDGSTATREELFTCEGINHFHLFLKRMLEEQQEVYKIIEEVLERNPNIVIICDEVGAGIVPMEKKDRDYRELVGRVCCYLAKKAVKVERIVCGIGVVLK